MANSPLHRLSALGRAWVGDVGRATNATLIDAGFDTPLAGNRSRDRSRCADTTQQQPGTPTRPTPTGWSG